MIFDIKVLKLYQSNKEVELESNFLTKNEQKLNLSDEA